MTSRVAIDGSYGEGGGQILRTSISLAAITGRAAEIVHIRAGRARPGLQPQHLTAVRAAAAICSAHLEGAEPGSDRLLFEPRTPVQPGDYRLEIGTAGAVGLVAQTVAIPLALADRASSVAVTGGTHVPHAPPADYLESVYQPALATAGWPGSLRIEAAGFYPRGGGRVTLSVQPAAPRAIEMAERGRLVRLAAFIVTSKLPEHVAERGAATVERFMKGIGRAVEVHRRDLDSAGPGAAVVLCAECEGGHAGFTALGERGKPMERVADEACEAFLHWWKTGAACDEHLADQLVLPAMLAPGISRFNAPAVTEHLRTVLWVAQQFVPLRVSIGESDDGTSAVHLERKQ